MMAEHVLVEAGKIVHVFKNSTAPTGQAGVHEVQPGTAYVGDGYKDGQIIRNAFPVSEEEIKAECQRRILAEYPIEIQSSVHSHGSTADRDQMMNVITWLVQCSKMLCQLPQIPHDYREDKYWTGAHALSRPKLGGSQDLPVPPQPLGLPHPNMMGQQSPWGGMPYPMAPMIFMPQAAPAPIIINGAAPSGPMVFQGPNETRVIPAQQPAPVQIYHSNPALSPASEPAPVAGSPHIGRGLSGPSPGLPAASPATVETPVDQHALWDAAEIAYGGSESSKANAQNMLRPLANKAGMDVEAYVKTLLFEKFQHMQQQVSRAAS